MCCNPSFLDVIADHTADVFIPHYVPRTPRRGDQSVKDTTYTGGEMARIRELAFGAPEGADVQRVLRRQRVEMHAASMERVRGWGNTIMGARKKRLAAQDEKARRLEEERQKVDADWAVLRAKEREEAIRRARMLQHFEEPRVKALHSQLLMSNVLEERDRQKEYKLKYDQANQIREKTDVLKMRLALLDGIEKDRQASERRRAERFDFAAALRHEIQHKESEKRAAKQLESEYYHRVNAAIEREDREVEVARRVVKEQLAKERCSVLAELIAEKEAVKKSAVARARALERENARFNEVKEFHAEKKKEYEAALARCVLSLSFPFARARAHAHACVHARTSYTNDNDRGYKNADTNPSEREKLFEIVSQIPTRMDQEAASKLAAYIEKSSHAKDHVDGERRAREQAKHARQLAEQREFQTERRRFVQAQRDAERVAKMQDRRVQMAEADKYERETRELAESRKQVLLGLSAFQAEQIVSWMRECVNCVRA
nr:hypothetical protein HK105_002501 [Polyrhizophydium stewartii]